MLSMRLRRVSGAFCLSLVFLAVSLAGCGTKKPDQQQRGPGAVPVTVAQVALKDVPIELRAIGNVEPYSTVQIKSQINAQLMTVHFKEGQDVREGDLLFTLDDRQLVADLNKAGSQLLRDQALAANVRAKAERYTQLNREGVISKQEYDAVQADAQSNEAAVQADRATLENAKVQVTYAKIYSPISGRTGALSVNAGNQVKANDVPLVTINQINPIYVSFSLPEQELAGVKRFLSLAGGKLKVTALINGDRSQPEFGQLSFIDNSVNAQTGTIRLKASFLNENKRLWPGQFVDSILTLGNQPGATVVPSQAVQNSQSGQFVYVVKPDQTVEMRPVAVQRTYNDLSIIGKGLQRGETVVTDGQLRLAPKFKVDIKNNAQQAAVPTAANGSPGNEPLNGTNGAGAGGSR